MQARIRSREKALRSRPPQIASLSRSRPLARPQPVRLHPSCGFLRAVRRIQAVPPACSRFRLQSGCFASTQPVSPPRSLFRLHSGCLASTQAIPEAARAGVLDHDSLTCASDHEIMGGRSIEVGTPLSEIPPSRGTSGRGTRLGKQETNGNSGHASGLVHPFTRPLFTTHLSRRRPSLSSPDTDFQRRISRALPSGNESTAIPIQPAVRIRPNRTQVCHS